MGGFVIKTLVLSLILIFLVSCNTGVQTQEEAIFSKDCAYGGTEMIIPVGQEQLVNGIYFTVVSTNSEKCIFEGFSSYKLGNILIPAISDRLELSVGKIYELNANNQKFLVKITKADSSNCYIYQLKENCCGNLICESGESNCENNDCLNEEQSAQRTQPEQQKTNSIISTSSLITPACNFNGICQQSLNENKTNCNNDCHSITQCTSRGAYTKALDTIEFTLKPIGSMRSLSIYSDNYFCGNMSYEDIKRTADFICENLNGNYFYTKAERNYLYSKAIAFTLEVPRENLRNSPRSSVKCAYKNSSSSPNLGFIGNINGPEKDLIIRRIRCCVKSCKSDNNCNNSNYRCLSNICQRKEGDECKSDRDCYYNLDYQEQSGLSCIEGSCELSAEDQSDCNANPWNIDSALYEDGSCTVKSCSGNNDCAQYNFDGRPNWKCIIVDKTNKTDKYCARSYCTSDNQCNNEEDGWKCVKFKADPDTNTPSYKECEKTCDYSYDCPTNYRCDNETADKNICVKGCIYNTDCSGGVCISGKCEKSCTTDWDCPPYERCNPEKRICYDAKNEIYCNNSKCPLNYYCNKSGNEDVCFSGCITNENCQIGSICYLKKCLKVCSIDSDCPKNFYCNQSIGNGTCFPGCINDGNCQSGLVCNLGQCKNPCTNNRDCPPQLPVCGEDGFCKRR